MSGVLSTQLSGVARRPARLLLTGLAILVASFVVYSTVLAQQITKRSLLDELSGTPAAVDLVVSNGSLSTQELAAIRRTPGVAEAVVQGALYGENGGDEVEIAADPGSGPLSMITMTQGHFPAAAGQIVVTPHTLQRLTLSVGGTLRLATWDENGKSIARQYTVVGVATSTSDNGNQAYGREADILASGGSGAISSIDLRYAAGADATTVTSQVNAIVAAGTPKDADHTKPEVQTGATVRHAEAVAKASSVNSLFEAVAMFVAIAVVAAGLVAASTFRIVFAQRLRQLALLRAIGARRTAISWALAAEGALTGLATGATGVVLALVAGNLAPLILKAFGKNLASPGFPVPQAVGTVLLAVVITTVAVLAPAWSAARVSPLEALRSSATTGARRDIGVLRWIFGLLFAAGAALLAAYVVKNFPGVRPTNYNAQDELLPVVASGALAFFALIALGPVVVRPALALLAWPIRRTGSVGKLAAGGVGGAPRRAAAVSVVVALGVTLITGVLVGGASLKVLADRDSASSAPTDFEVTSGDDGGPVPAAVLQKIQSQAALTRVVSYRRIDDISFASDPQTGTTGMAITDLDTSSVPRLKELDLAKGSLAGVAPGKALVSGFTAESQHVGVGDQLTVVKGKQRLTVTVAGVFNGDAPLHCSVLVSPADLTKFGAGTAIQGVLADASGSGETGITKGQQALAAINAGNDSRYKIDVLADERDQIDGDIALLQAILIGLVGLTVIIAVVGVGTTTALSVVERVRESGLLRAVGLSRAGLRTMLTTESALYGVIGGALGVILGTPYAWLFVKALGVDAPLAFPGWQVLAVFLLVIAMTALAGILPARRAAKVSPVAALGTE